MQEICAFLVVTLPATFSTLAIFIITLPFSIYYSGQDITFFWTQRVKLPKCKNCQLWKVLKQQWLLAVLKVKSFLFNALCTEFYYRHESDGHMSLQRMREGQWPTSQEKLYQGEEQQRTPNCNYILNTPPFCCCDKTLWLQQVFWSSLTLRHYFHKIINVLSQIQKMGFIGLSKWFFFSPSQHESQSL